MPALSPTMEEGNLAKWLVKVGDKIEPGQVIAEIETDKATMEVEAVDEGVIAEILVAEGTQGVKVNTPIAVLSGEAQQPSPPRGRGRVRGAHDEHVSRNNTRRAQNERTATPQFTTSVFGRPPHPSAAPTPSPPVGRGIPTPLPLGGEAG